MLEFTNPYCHTIVLYHLLSTLVYALLRFTNLQLTRFTFCPFWLFATNTQRIIFHHISLLLYELYMTPKWFLLYLYQYFKIVSVRGSCCFSCRIIIVTTVLQFADMYVYRVIYRHMSAIYNVSFAVYVFFSEIIGKS